MSLMVFVTISCHPGGSDKSSDADTGMKTGTDTAINRGTPGPSGTEPGAGDTTQKHRDSLKKAKDISDSTGGPATTPKYILFNIAYTNLISKWLWKNFSFTKYSRPGHGLSGMVILIDTGKRSN